MVMPETETPPERSMEDELASFQNELAEPKKRRGRQPGSKNSPSKFKITDVREGLHTLIEAGNNIFRNGSKYAAFALEPTEIKGLADALAQEFQVNPKLQRLVAGAGKISPHLALIQVTASIAITRWNMYQVMLQQQKSSGPRAMDNIPTTPEPVSTPIPDSVPPQERVRAVQV